MLHAALVSACPPTGAGRCAWWQIPSVMQLCVRVGVLAPWWWWWWWWGGAPLRQIVVPGFMQLGADLQWLSAFPGEAEILYPPLTYLKPTGKAERFDAESVDGERVSFTVVELQPTLGA